MMQSKLISIARRNLLLAGACAISSTLGFSSYAAAQSTATAPAESAVQEVVVTARKKPESLIEIPAGITELGPTTLANCNIQEFNDYATEIPDLAFSVGSTEGVSRARTGAIRGIGGSNMTSFYIDDTPVPDTINPHLVDINRIEVLKEAFGTKIEIDGAVGVIHVSATK